MYFQIDAYSESTLEAVVYPLLFGVCVFVFVVAFLSKVWRGPMWDTPTEGEKEVIRKIFPGSYTDSDGNQVQENPYRDYVDDD